MDRPIANSALSTRSPQASDQPLETRTSSAQKHAFEDALLKAEKPTGNTNNEQSKLASHSDQANAIIQAAELLSSINGSGTDESPVTLAALAAGVPSEAPVSLLQAGQFVSNLDVLGNDLNTDGKNAQPGVAMTGTGTAPALSIDSTGQMSVGSLVGPYGADTLSALLTRINTRQPDANGIWNIKVLNAAGGVDSLQLQQTVPGAWNLRVTMESTARSHNRHFVEQLRNELNERGHRITQLSFDDSSGNQSDASQSPV